jgi:hypothetical protein
MNKAEAEAAETITKAEVRKDKTILFFISVRYELRELGEQAHLKAIGCPQQFVLISFVDN